MSRNVPEFSSGDKFFLNFDSLDSFFEFLHESKKSFCKELETVYVRERTFRTMNSEQFRAAGAKMVDYAIEYMETINKREPLPHVVPGWLAKVMPPQAPVKGEPFENIFNDFEKVVMEGTSKRST